MIQINMEEELLRVWFSGNNFKEIVAKCKELGGKYYPDVKSWYWPLIRLPTLITEFEKIDTVSTCYYCKEYLTRNKNLIDNTEEEVGKLSGYFYKHQLETYKYLIGGGKGVFSQTGTGKSIPVASAIETFLSKKVIDKYLIISPLSVFEVWIKELGIAQGLLGTQSKYLVLSGSSDLPDSLEGIDGIILTPALFRNVHEKLKELLSNYIIVAEECHWMCNPKSKVSKALYSMEPKLKIAITATPIKKRVEDIWNIINWIEPGYLGTYWDFYNKYIVTTPRTIKKRVLEDDEYKLKTINIREFVGYKNLNHLESTIKEVSIRHLRDDVLDLPPRIFEVRYVDMTREQRQIYNAIRDELWAEIKDLDPFEQYNAMVLNPLTKAVRLLQAANSPSLFGEAESTIKLDILDEIMEESGEPIVVFTQWKHTLQKLRDKYGKRIVTIEGGDKDRAEVVRLFQEKKVDLIAGTSALQEGVTLTSGYITVYMDRNHSALHRVQSTGRTNRIGQEKTCVYIDVVTRDTVDILPLEVINLNIEIMDKVLTASDGEVNSLISKLNIEQYLKG